MEQHRVQRIAEKELAKAIAYFEKKRTGLGREFRIEFDHAVDVIRDNPQIGAIWKRSKYRTWVLRRFNYVIVYTVKEGVLWIVAVAHGSRRPEYWKSRKLE